MGYIRKPKNSTSVPRPVSAPDFLLSRSTGSIRTRGSLDQYSSIDTAQEALDTGHADYVVGAVPFDIDRPSALTRPKHVVRTAAPLEPPAFFRGMPLHSMVRTENPSQEEHKQRIGYILDSLRQGAVDKVVLARAIELVRTDRNHSTFDPQLLAARLLDGSPNRDGFLVDLTPAGEGFKGHQFLGSSPELLIRRRGNKVVSHPLAGSVPREGSPREDRNVSEQLQRSTKDLTEHQFVTEAISNTLAPLCTTLSVPSQPELTSTREMWHLGSRIEGTLKPQNGRIPSVLELVQLLHPTPAVCGNPREPAQAIISDIEGDRRFYAGTVGWSNRHGDGEWVVAIRCAELFDHNKRAITWAGGGIVAASVPESELAETSAKLTTILSAFGAL